MQNKLAFVGGAFLLAAIVKALQYERDQIRDHAYDILGSAAFVSLAVAFSLHFYDPTTTSEVFSPKTPSGAFRLNTKPYGHSCE